MPAGLLERAMSEPLSVGRDEVLYLICSHARVAIGRELNENGHHSAYRAEGAIGGPFKYVQTKPPWATIRFPERVRPSGLGWAVLDPLGEELEGLLPNPSFDPLSDPEGVDGLHRHELLPWIFDRHLELGKSSDADRGTVEGGEIEFRLEYIGKAGEEALRRATGPHHKMPIILGRMLMYEPERLVYVLPCDIRAVRYGPETKDESFELLPLASAAESTGLSRELLISAAEEALIAGLGAPQNQRNTAARQFPSSDAGDQLAAKDIDEFFVGFAGIPERVSIEGTRNRVVNGSRGIKFDLASGTQVQPQTTEKCL